jgi:D-3-phosphoglycerate dehydrogenase
MRLVITDHRFPSLSIEKGLVESAGGELRAFQCSTEQEVISVAGDADALLVQFAPITRAVMATLTRCKAIVRYGVGLDNIDLEAASALRIRVCNIPDYCVDEVADHAFSLALALTRQIVEIDTLVKSGVWKQTAPRPMPASRDMTFITIGFGRIARAVLQRAEACGFGVAACDPYLSESSARQRHIRLLNMKQALAAADVLSLHVPLTKTTRHLINADALSFVKPTGVIINTARGGLIDTVALAKALSIGQLAGAGLDVFEEEPLPYSHPLRKCSNVLLTSHMAWYSEASGPELQRMAAEEAIRAMQGKPLHSCVV